MPFKGFKHSPETRAKMRISNHPSFLGYHHSESTKEKMMMMDASQCSEVIDLYRGGLTGDEIAQRLDVGRDPVYFWLKKNNIEMRKKGQRKGIPAWNKGLKFDETQKAKLNLSGLELGRSWNKGKIGLCSENTIQKMSESHTGKNGPESSNWQGGISLAYKTGYFSIQYKEWRKAVFARDNYTCQKCNIRIGEGKTIYLTAHHVKSFAKYPELRFVVENGKTLCELCHCEEDKYRARFMKKETSNF